MEKGAVALLDELDLANPAKVMCLQSILEGKGYFIKKTGEFIRDMRIFDEDRSLYWYPSVLNMGNLGIIYPEANLESEFSLDAGIGFVWKYAKPVKVPKEDRDKYDGHEFRLDIENAVTYEKYEFLQACKDMGITKDL